ncbi:MAG: DNA-binding response regulator [Acidimicrobiia bacterium]
MTTAVVVDEWCLVREGVRALASGLGITSRVLASTATEALAELRPGELIVVGVCPDVSTESVVRLARAVDGVRVVVLAAKFDRATVLALCTAGADAVLDRSAADIQLDIALETIAKAHRYLAPSVLDVVFSPSQGEPMRPARLTLRESAVLELLATGRSNRDIAAELHIGTETVKTHLSNLYVKLGVTRRDQAIAAALRSGLL